MLAIVDIETTGLNYILDEILEVAILLVEDDLTVVQEFPGVTIRPTNAALLRMNKFVQDMHRDSGLMDEIRVRGTNHFDAYQQVLAWVRDWIPKNTPMAGNSVGFDKSFLQYWMPEVAELFHYRVADASAVRELAHRWCPELTKMEPPSKGAHRSLSDCYDSLSLLRFYKQFLFERVK